jgi:hypothetical protein
MDPVYVQAAVTIVTTLCGYGAVRGKLNLLLREVGILKREQTTDKQTITDLKEEVRILKTIAHSHR